MLEEDALHILFEPGDRPGRTGIRDATEVEVYAPFPPEIHAVLWPQCSSRRLSRPVAGYVRVAGGYLPLGRLVQRGAAYLGTTLYRMTYQLETPISFRVLDRVRAAPVDQPCPGAEWLRHLPHDPVSALRGFVTEWYADLAPPLGPLSSAVMPTPLAVAYEVIAGRDVFRQDGLFPPHELKQDHAGRLVFGYENQGCFRLLTLPEGDDPPVWIHWDDEEPLLSALPLSCFLLATLLFEALLTSEYRMHGRVWREDKERAVAGLKRVPLAGREIHDDNAETYVGRGLVIQAQPWDEDTWTISAAARHRADLLPVERFRNM
ncbi:hypothetical protein [Catenuloplanes indicus]|uniref:Uncharacterized protein n=1 Tax=Catenuloplanes indicus TaxID=137267 RepID=A0AAE3VXH8_9ACTN|nr:hypothetical protein [Catenuloplanes indicus]MDQ0365107.1 hypothetical protein [Catenuloplanes indicus]